MRHLYRARHCRFRTKLLIFCKFHPGLRSACSVAASYKPPMLVTRVRLPACASSSHIPLPDAKLRQAFACFRFRHAHLGKRRRRALLFSRRSVRSQDLFQSWTSAHFHSCLGVQNTRGGTRTRNLLLRREAPYPLGHTSGCEPSWCVGLTARVPAPVDMAWISIASGNANIASCLQVSNDTCGIRTHAGRPHRLSRPTP